MPMFGRKESDHPMEEMSALLRIIFVSQDSFRGRLQFNTQLNLFAERGDDLFEFCVGVAPSSKSGGASTAWFP